MSRVLLRVCVLVGVYAAIAQAATDPCLAGRGYIKAGFGLPANPDPATAKVITWDDFMNLKYPRALRTSKDLPSVADARSRIGPFETTLYSVIGFTLCGAYCKNGPMNLNLTRSEADEAKASPPSFDFGYGAPDCRQKEPIGAVLDAVDAAYQAYDPTHTGGTCSEGCGYMWSVIRITGYGFWEESFDNSAIGAKVIPALYPVIRIEYFCPPKFGGVGGPTDGTTACSSGPGIFSGTPGGGTSGGTPTPTPTPQPTGAGPTVVLPDDIRAAPLVMTNSSSTTVLFSTLAPAGATSDVTLSATSDSDGLVATINPSVIKAPGSGDAILTIQTTATTATGDHVITISASDGTSTGSASIFVTVICDPPFILGIDQPKNTTVALGRPANLTVKASGSGPLTYQWFSGAKGLVNFPLAIGSSPNFTTSAINDTASYWVRVTNPCGSIDSQTVTVSVAASAKASSPRR